LKTGDIILKSSGCDLVINLLKKIEVWGDSVLKGVIYDVQKKKYLRLKMDTIINKLSELGLSIKNNSRFGMTAPKARNLMLNSLEKGTKADIAIIEFGGNDCDYKWEEISEDPKGHHLPKTPINSFKECITDMVIRFRDHGIKPVLMNLPPINSEKYFNWISRGLNADAILSWLGDKELIYRHHESYSLAIMNVAQKLSCPFIDVRGPFLLKRDYYNYLCEDGIHPNEEGYNIMKQTIVKYAINGV
jgi:acyl-CoA thioesterase-1